MEGVWLKEKDELNYHRMYEARKEVDTINYAPVDAHHLVSIQLSPRLIGRSLSGMSGEAMPAMAGVAGLVHRRSLQPYTGASLETVLRRERGERRK